MPHYVIIAPVIAGALTQILKFLLAKRKLSVDALIAGYGGMPSSHSALVTALAVAVGLEAGWNTPVFAVALIFAVVTMRDAAGFRWSLGEAVSRLLNKENENAETVSMGHKPLEVIIGAAIGAAVSALLWLI